MASLNEYIGAARPRTLPLAFSSILTGGAIALERNVMRWEILLLALLTTLFLQVLSNLANDYGDFKKGVDDPSRVGPTRAMQSGAINSSSMKNAIVWMAVLALITGTLMLYISGIGLNWKGMAFFVSGLAAIAAALFYTIGKRPYGYVGLGDIAVFIFFGLLGVLGSSILHDLRLPIIYEVYPAAGIGFFSAAVLNLNNMRDAIPDAKSGKNTMAVILGPSTSRLYHALLISFGIISFIIYSASSGSTPSEWFYILIMPLLILHLIRVFRAKENRLLDPELKKVALITFGISILFLVGRL